MPTRATTTDNVSESLNISSFSSATWLLPRRVSGQGKLKLISQPLQESVVKEVEEENEIGNASPSYSFPRK